MIIVERTTKSGMPIRIRLNDGNHDFTEADAVELVQKLVAAGVATPAPTDNGKVREALKEIATQDDVEMILDPTWAKRIVLAALGEGGV